MVDDNKELEKLRRKLKQVTAERDKLLSENRRLRNDYSTETLTENKDISLSSSNRLDSSHEIKEIFTLIQTNIDSSQPDYIKLFCSLFHGREDICQNVVEPKNPENWLQPGLS